MNKEKRKNKLLLTYPNQKWHKNDLVTNWMNPPVTLCLLGAMVKDLVDVKIIDANFYNLSREKFRAEVENWDPDYVGISVLTNEYGNILNVAAGIIKEIDKNTVVIAGGVHVTTNYSKIIEDQNIDFACRGEGEYLLRELLLYLTGEGEMPKEGLIYRDQDKNVHIQDHRLVEDLTQLPWPDYSLVNFHDYIERHTRIGPNRHPDLPGTYLQVTRGCPVQCSFCQTPFVSGLKIRKRDITDVVKEFHFLKKRYGIKAVTFLDDNLFLHKNYAKKLLREMIDTKLDIKWGCGTVAIFSIDEELVNLMKESGCKTIGVSVESGTKRVLREIVKKPIKNLDEIPDKIAMIKSRGIPVRAAFIIGFPGETWEEIRETIRFAENCNADYIKIFVAVPLPGTQLWDLAQSLNALYQGDGEYSIDWRHSKILSDEWTTRDVSILRAYEWDRINFAADRIEKTADLWGCSIEELKEVRKKTRDALEL